MDKIKREQITLLECNEPNMADIAKGRKLGIHLENDQGICWCNPVIKTDPKTGLKTVSHKELEQ